MKGTLGYLLLFGGIGAAIYFLLKSGSPDPVAGAANKILQDPVKASQIPGATTQDKYAYLIQAGSKILNDILQGVGIVKPTVSTPGTTA
jgi:hypothetical protein